MLTRVRTALDLGITNVVRALGYRIRLRAGVHPVQRVRTRVAPQGSFFRSSITRDIPAEPPNAWRAHTHFFGWIERPHHGEPPDWHTDVVRGARAPAIDQPWWTIPDFPDGHSDIKAIWEASRFDWVVAFAQQAVSGETASSAHLERWIESWVRANPAYLGANWKCGQETSIRVMHLAVAAHVLGTVDDLQPALVELVVQHLERIAPTISYAIAQDNNHGTSEAAALFIGGAWLERVDQARARAWMTMGRALLEERVTRLVARDGTFSQYSVNYHRLMLDTVSLAEWWRRSLRLPPFASTLYERMDAATRWLRAMVDDVSGAAPNIGANDGANLLPLTNADYGDYRPAVQLAAALFRPEAAYADGPWNAQLQWLGIPVPRVGAARRASEVFDDGGFAVLRQGTATAVVRYPRFRFRPSHADALHVDLWVDGRNLLRDTGTFSYAASEDIVGLFSGTRGHNTIEFDDRDQMPRLGRFLWGRWLRTEQVSEICVEAERTTFSASYRDARGATHARTIELYGDRLIVHDHIAGVADHATLRWYLSPGPWRLTGDGASNGPHKLRVTGDAAIDRREIVSGWESRHYLQRARLPVLEVTIRSAGRVVSEYRWRGYVTAAPTP